MFKKYIQKLNLFSLYSQIKATCQKWYNDIFKIKDSEIQKYRYTKILSKTKLKYLTKVRYRKTKKDCYDILEKVQRNDMKSFFLLFFPFTLPSSALLSFHSISFKFQLYLILIIFIK